MIERPKTKDRAAGRWGEILPALGVSPNFLKNRHGPCPICGGRDRFRFDNKDGSGSYYCNQCGPGDGITMLRKLHGWDFATACGEIDRVLGDAAPLGVQPDRSRQRDETKRLRAIERALSSACHPDVVEAYLRRRGLAVSSPVLRGDRACAYYDEDGNLVGRYPAMLAPILGPDGSLQSVHRTYDATVTPRKKILPAVRTINGGAVRLIEATDELAVAEGIENALAVHQMYRLPVWATITAHGMEVFEPPEGLRRLLIFADNDHNCVGQAAAFNLAKRVLKDNRLQAEVMIPPRVGTDWLDVLLEEAA